MHHPSPRVLPLVLLIGLIPVSALHSAEAVKTGEKRDTLIYVRTDPPGAKVLINGEEVGKSDGLFPVDPGSGTILIELEGRKPDKRQVIVRANAITRLEVSLEPKPAGESVPEAKLQPGLESHDPRFTRKLPQGTVELIGVTNLPLGEKSQWWKPDGSPVELGTFLRKSPRYSSFLPGKTRAFLVRFEGLPDTSSRAWRINPSEGWWECNAATDAGGKTLAGCYLFCPGFQKSVATADLRVGVDGGAWETVATQRADSLGVLRIRRDGFDSTMTLLQAEKFGTYIEDSTRLTFTTDIPYGRWKTRLVAVTEDGTEHAGSMGSANGTGAAIFRNLQLASIKEFRLQIRSFDWVDFKTIALEPATGTDIEVISDVKSSASDKEVEQ